MSPNAASSRSSYGTVDQENGNDDEREELLHESFETETSFSEGDSADELQDGVRKIEAINLTWTTRSLTIAYVRFVVVYSYGLGSADSRSIFLMAFCTSLEGQTIMSLSAYATSAFSRHSLISTVLVVQNVVNGEITLMLPPIMLTG